MSSITNGLFGGGKGLSFEAQQAELVSPTDSAQLERAYHQQQNALLQQEGQLNQINAQNGFQNQTDVYNQLGQVASGAINPAQAQLNNNTQANIANQSAMMAGQRGAAGNPALLARQAAQQGGQLQQNAVGQAAALQAQNQMNAIGAQGNMANQQANQALNAQQAYNSNVANTQGQLLNSMNSYNQAKIGNIQQANQANAAIAQEAAKGQMDIFKGVTNAAGSAMKIPGMGPKPAAEGGLISNGEVMKAPQSHAGKHFHMFAQGGAVKALLSPGEKYLPPQAVEAVKQGANPMEVGKEIPGKPKVKGAKDSYANDTVPATLEEGGIVLPRSVTQSKNPHWAAHRFVSALMKEKAMKGKK